MKPKLLLLTAILVMCPLNWAHSERIGPYDLILMRSREEVRASSFWNHLSCLPPAAVDTSEYIHKDSALVFYIYVCDSLGKESLLINLDTAVPSPIQNPDIYFSTGIPIYNFAPLNTRLQIHWLDSVVIQECDNWYSHLSGTGGTRCDTLYWRMTACSLSVIEEGK